MLLVDGVRYYEWEPKGPQAEDELEQIVIEHSEDIFGEKSIYLDKKYKLKSVSGTGSIPDGISIVFGDQPEWHIVEVELSNHDIYGHVIQQVTKFMDGIENQVTKNNLFDAIWNDIDSDNLLKYKLNKTLQSLNPYQYVSNLILKKQPILTVVIEKEQPSLDNTLKKFNYLQHKIVELRTFRRENADNVHVHLFEPIR